MSFHIPAELFDSLLILALTLVWRGYRRMWRHILRVERRVLMVMVMLRDRGFDVPSERDTELFCRANDIEGK